MKFAARFMIIIASITALATQSFAGEIRSKVSPGVIQITQNTDKSISFNFCRGGENLDCAPLGNRNSYSADEIAFRYNSLIHQEHRIYEDTTIWVVGATLVAGFLMSQATPVAPVVDGATGTAAVTVASVEVVDTAITTGVEATMEGESVTAEMAADSKAEAALLSRITNILSTRIIPKVSATVLSKGTILALGGSLASIVHGWVGANNSSSPFYEKKLANTLRPNDIDSTGILYVNGPIENYAQSLSSALDSEY